MAKEGESKADLRATEKEVALKVSKIDIGLKEVEKEADTKEHASIVEKSATRRRNAWSIWLGRWDSNARRKRRLVKLETKETHGWWQE